MVSTQRVKNTATPPEIAKVIRSNMTSIDCRRISNPMLDEVATDFEGFLCDLVRLTTRPNAVAVGKAAVLAFGGSEQEATFFGSRVHAVVSYCRTKGKGSTSGAKLNRAVRKIWSYIKACNPEESSGSSADSVTKLFKGPKGKELRERAIKFMSTSPDLDQEILPPSGGPLDSPIDFWKKKRRMYSSSPREKNSIERSRSSKPEGKKNTADAPEDTFALYGLKQTLNFDGPLMDESIVDVLDSSQEDSPPPRLALDPRAAPKGKGKGKAPPSQAWIDDYNKSQVIIASCVDPVARCAYRLLQGGQRVNAAMSTGPRGLALATFPGEEPAETELPNVILQAPVRVSKAKAQPKGKAEAKSKAKPKRKAKAKKSVKASSSNASAAEIESSDEEEAEEDLEEEDEAVEADEEPDPEIERKWSEAEIAELKQRGAAHAGKLGQLKLTQGSKQTYFVSPNSSPALVCSVSLQQSPNHVDVCCTALDLVIKKNLDKEGALLLRKQFLDV